MQEGYSDRIELYKYSHPVIYEFYLPAEKKELIAESLKIWRDKSNSLTMWIRRADNRWLEKEVKVKLVSSPVTAV